MGIDLHLLDTNTREAVSSVLQEVLRDDRNAELVDFDPVSDLPQRFDEPPRSLGLRLDSNYQFSDLRKDVAFLAGADLVVSTRLHVGVVALSFGVPFISAFGRPKTVAFMTAVGMGDRCFRSTSDLERVAALLRSIRLGEDITCARLYHQAAASAGHLTALSDWLVKDVSR